MSKEKQKTSEQNFTQDKKLPSKPTSVPVQSQPITKDKK